MLSEAQPLHEAEHLAGHQHIRQGVQPGSFALQDAQCCRSGGPAHLIAQYQSAYTIRTTFMRMLKLPDSCATLETV